MKCPSLDSSKCVVYSGVRFKVIWAASKNYSRMNGKKSGFTMYTFFYLYIINFFMDDRPVGIIKIALYWYCQSACLQDSLPPSSRVCSSCLGPKQQERYIRHRTTLISSSTTYGWHHLRDGVKNVKTKVGLTPLHKRRDFRCAFLLKKDATPHCSSHTMR